jgi:hypothetical protein
VFSELVTNRHSLVEKESVGRRYSSAARAQCGRGCAGRRWLNLAGLATGLITPYIWPAARLERLVYCTAPRDRADDPTSLADQQTYIDALRLRNPDMLVEYGKYAPRISRSP